MRGWGTWATLSVWILASSDWRRHPTGPAVIHTHASSERPKTHKLSSASCKNGRGAISGQGRTSYRHIQSAITCNRKVSTLQFLLQRIWGIYPSPFSLLDLLDLNRFLCVRPLEPSRQASAPCSFVLLPVRSWFSGKSGLPRSAPRRRFARSAEH